MLRGAHPTVAALKANIMRAPLDSSCRDLIACRVVRCGCCRSARIYPRFNVSLFRQDSQAIVAQRLRKPWGAKAEARGARVLWIAPAAEAQMPADQHCNDEARDPCHSPPELTLDPLSAQRQVRQGHQEPVQAHEGRQLWVASGRSAIIQRQARSLRTVGPNASCLILIPGAKSSAHLIGGAKLPSSPRKRGPSAGSPLSRGEQELSPLGVARGFVS